MKIKSIGNTHEQKSQKKMKIWKWNENSAAIVSVVCERQWTVKWCDIYYNKCGQNTKLIYQSGGYINDIELTKKWKM